VPIGSPCYVTREEVKVALDVSSAAYADARVDRACESGSRAVEGCLHRRFYPQAGTRYFPWPSADMSTPWRLWLDGDELISASTVMSAGTAVPSTDYYLEPANTGPPYAAVEINLGRSSAFGGGSTNQRSIAITGVYGYAADETPGGSTAEALDASETGVDVTDSAAVGVGALIRVDDERMLVTGKTMLTTGQTLQAALTASAAGTAVSVTTGTGHTVGETILLDAERMLVQDIAGNTLTVRRAYDGTVLAAHTGSTIYAPRTLTVTRGAVGTTAATHLTAAPVFVHAPPPLVRDLALAYSLNQLLQEQSGYARVSGAGDNQREFTGRGITDLEDAARARYGRKARTRAV
jgi:hypothetical protein